MAANIGKEMSFKIHSKLIESTIKRKTASGASLTRDEQVQPEGKEAEKPKKIRVGLMTMLKINQLKTKRMPRSQAEHRRCQIKRRKDFPFRIQIYRT